MARGFESKDVEFQQAEAERPKGQGRSLTPLERQTQERQRTVTMALTNVRAELASATNPRHREMLKQAIAALEEQLASRE
jgi:hypothetical protein